jgi:hypothetical protein
MLAGIRLVALASLAAGVGGCVGSRVSYSPRDHMLTLLRYNHFLSLGPCGSSWNYDDETYILFPLDSDHGDAYTLKVYHDGPMKVSSGSVALDPAKKKVKIDLMLAAPNEPPAPCRFNGLRRYVEYDPTPCDATRSSIEPSWEAATTAPSGKRN